MQFLNVILDTAVMQYLHQYLIQQNKIRVVSFTEFLCDIIDLEDLILSS